MAPLSSLKMGIFSLDLFAVDLQSRKLRAEQENGDGVELLLKEVSDIKPKELTPTELFEIEVEETLRALPVLNKKDLRVGMSVSVTIDTTYENDVPIIIKPFANIFRLF